MREVKIFRDGGLDERMALACELDEGEEVAISFKDFSVAVFAGSRKVCDGGDLRFGHNLGIVQIGKGIDKDVGGPVAYYLLDPRLASKIHRHRLFHKLVTESSGGNGRNEARYAKHPFWRVKPFPTDRGACWMTYEGEKKTRDQAFPDGLYKPEYWQDI